MARKSNMILFIGLGLFILVLLPNFNNLFSTGSQTQQWKPWNPRHVLFVVYDPNIQSSGSQKLHSVMGWNDPNQLVNQVISDLNIASNGQLNYQLVNTLVLNQYPKKADGFQYTESSYLACWSDHSKCHKPDTADYNQIINDVGACSKLNNNQIDELWLIGAPYFGFYESALAGPNGFFYNGPTYVNICNRLMPIMGFNYERTDSEMVHDFGHRAEFTMTKVFSDNYASLSNEDKNIFDHFIYNQPLTTIKNTYGCGLIHYPPNAPRGSSYVYDSTNYVQSNCEDFVNYPNLQGTTKSINCQEWGCSSSGYYIWWFNNMPSNDGATNGVLNNWWIYIADPNYALYSYSTGIGGGGTTTATSVYTTVVIGDPWTYSTTSSSVLSATTTLPYGTCRSDCPPPSTSTSTILSITTSSTTLIHTSSGTSTTTLFHTTGSGGSQPANINAILIISGITLSLYIIGTLV